MCIILIFCDTWKLYVRASRGHIHTPCRRKRETLQRGYIITPPPTLPPYIVTSPRLLAVHIRQQQMRSTYQCTQAARPCSHTTSMNSYSTRGRSISLTPPLSSSSCYYYYILQHATYTMFSDNSSTIMGLGQSLPAVKTCSE